VTRVADRENVAKLPVVRAFYDVFYQLEGSFYQRVVRALDVPRPQRALGVNALDEITLDNTRVGFGFGLQAHTAHVLLTRAQVASSIDGGVFLNLSFEPAFEPPPRVTRRNR
ncbi:MAG TPA: hypothetical protein VM513_28735, partial [Kofleriaceae bacterium]|nr:hypothetical protein [Kofleriaceae bacterium]